jgi:hypothetical protein
MTDSIFIMTRIYKYLTDTNHNLTEMVFAAAEKQKMPEKQQNLRKLQAIKKPPRNSEAA